MFFAELGKYLREIREICGTFFLLLQKLFL